ncbi:hypothetical protein [Ferrovum sp.]|uniref:hypothetical protein n=1 Tax=Ferrovum sp. TaxID=2609467 RepID=UPI00260FFA5D|nr:hypothetical protein [Ferrovum sp.]
MSQEPNASTFTPVAGTVEEEILITMTVKEWAEEFKPLANPVNPNADIRGYVEDDPSAGILFDAQSRRDAFFIKEIIKEIFARQVGSPRSLWNIWTFFEILSEDENEEETVEEYAVAGYRQEGEIDGKLLGWFVTKKPYNPDLEYLIRPDDEK